MTPPWVGAVVVPVPPSRRSGKRVAIGAEPDLLWGIGNWLTEMGCTIGAAVTTTHSPQLEAFPIDRVLIGDLEDLERDAADCDLLITHSHGRQAAERLQVPFLRMGIPMFDRLGAAHRVSIGYRGTRDLVFEIGNTFAAEGHEPGPDTWRPAQGRQGHEIQETMNHGNPQTKAHQPAVADGVH